ncbi:PQQ-dependent sugar dehydrogenase, partial [Pelagibacteraceae bacterium]|nr:PQQ-dependent sugar dehydrogenase [Pelagibacteraceae bacterium]
FYIPNLKEKNRSLNLQVKKYEQGLEGQLFKESESLSEKGKKYYVKEFFLPFPRLDTRLGWAAKENSKRAHYLEIVKDKVLVISGLGQTIYFDKENITSTKLNQKEIKNNIKELLKEKNYELYGIRDLFFEDNYIYISMLHKDKKKGITINLYRAEINFNKLNFETYFETNEYWPIHNVFTGGRIETFKDDKILFSIGFSKKYKAPQDKNSFLGKIIAIDKKTKNFELISFGHRNPQGLFFSNKNNLIINTEHGPYGGDEVNFNFLENNSIEKNFGWPISSKGKPYPGEEFLFEENNWLIKSHKENGFISPIKSYSPAIGISEIVYLEEGKKKILYVSSLRAGSIYIINLDEKLKKILNEDRLFFNEQRIRDLEFDSETNSFFVLFEYTPSVAIIKKLN